MFLQKQQLYTAYCHMMWCPDVISATGVVSHFMMTNYISSSHFSYRTFCFHLELVCVCLRLTMGWMVWGSNLFGDKIFCTCPYWPWDQYNHLYNG